MPSYSLVIRNGHVIDGTGTRPPYRADVGLDGDRIAAVGDLSAADTASVVDATDRCVAPGFIDVHVHGEIALLGGEERWSELKQGITTQLLAPDGFGWAGTDASGTRELWDYTRFAYGDTDFDVIPRSIGEYLALFDGTPGNVVPQVPHCAVRVAVMGWDARPATDAELAAMADTTREWMEAGACALNLGLDYQPSANATFEELVRLCRVAAEYDGVYVAHIRYHTIGREAAWRETVRLSRESGIPVHVSHERGDETLIPILDDVDRHGDDLTFESYLYPAGMTHMTMMLPMEYQQGTPAQVLERLKDPAVKKRALPIMGEWLGRCDQTVGYTKSGRYIGLSLREAAEKAGKDPLEFAYDLILEEDGFQAFVFPWQVPPDEAAATVARTAGHPRMIVASDGIYNIPHPHPRSTGCFARVLGEFVRERGLLTLEEAVYKMSGFPARRFRVPDRGELGEGKAADLVIFDAATVGAGSTFAEPLKPPVGIDAVIVNGQTVVSKGSPTGALPGRVLKRR